MRRRFVIALLSLGLANACYGQLTTTATPSADAFVTSANPTGNFGAAGALSVAASGLSKGEFRSLIRFDTSAIKSSFDAAFGAGNWTIQSATLRIGAAPPNNPIFNGNASGPGGTSVNTAGNFTALWIADDSWSEGSGTTGSPAITGVTFDASPDATGAQLLGTFNFPGGISGTTTYDLSLSAGLLADLNAGGLLSAQLIAAAGDSSIAYVFNSRSGGSAPLLSVTAIPEPGILALAGLLLPGLMQINRRRAPKDRSS